MVKAIWGRSVLENYGICEVLNVVFVFDEGAKRARDA
jgi:hypothetical protein